MREDYSPKQIRGHLKAEGKVCVSHETIYQYVWIDRKQVWTLFLAIKDTENVLERKDKRGIIKKITSSL